MSNAARPAPTCASLTTLAATGIARSARPPLPRNGWPIARPNSCRCAAETLITIAPTGQARGLKAHDPKHLGARIGLTAVLHTWGSALTHHPHAHIIVPGGGFSPDGQHWIACRPRVFLSVGVLSRLFRRRFLERLTAAYQVGRLEFFADQAALAQPAAFQTFLAALHKVECRVGGVVTGPTPGHRRQ